MLHPLWLLVHSLHWSRGIPSIIEKIPRHVRSEQFEKLSTSSGKGLVSTSRTYAAPKWDGNGVKMSKRPSCMPHPSQMLYGNLSKFSKRSNSVIRSRIGIKSDRCKVFMVDVMLQNVIQYSSEDNFILFDKIPVSTIKLRQ